MMYLKLAPYAALSALVGYIWVQNMQLDAKRAEIEHLTAKLASCDARISNISEDGKTDAEIDAKNDDDLVAVPNRWLRETQ